MSYTQRIINFAFSMQEQIKSKGLYKDSDFDAVLKEACASGWKWSGDVQKNKETVAVFLCAKFVTLSPPKYNNPVISSTPQKKVTKKECDANISHDLKNGYGIEWP